MNNKTLQLSESNWWNQCTFHGNISSKKHSIPFPNSYRTTATCWQAIKSVPHHLINACNKQTIYPPLPNVMRAFALTRCEPSRNLILCSFQDVKVVILGQDPYHGEGQAMGLSFSVPEGTKLPPSLRRIFKAVGMFNKFVYRQSTRYDRTLKRRFDGLGETRRSAFEPGVSADMETRAFTDLRSRLKSPFRIIVLDGTNSLTR